MTKKGSYFFPLVIGVISSCCLLSFVTRERGNEPRVLIFSKTGGFHHTSIPNGIAAVMQLGKQHGFACDSSTDSLQFNRTNLSRYAAVIFLNTTGNVLNDVQQTALQDFIHSGKGYVGVHAASDTEFDWPWYNRLVGAWFLDHPKQQQGRMNVIDRSFFATRHLPEIWSRWDEWYNFRDTHWDQVHVLITLDETSVQGSKNNGYHPISWYQDFEGGRSFYTALGHAEASYTDPDFLQHLLGGIQYAIGRK